MQFNKTDLTWLIDLGTLVAVIIGLSFAGIELRQLRAEQENQTVLQLFETIKSDQYIEASSLIQALPNGLSATELQAHLTEEDSLLIDQLQLTFEGLGIMVYRGDVSIDWVDELFRLNILTSWDKLENLTLQQREESGYLGWNEWHQWLAERLRERSENQPIPAYDAYQDWKP